MKTRRHPSQSGVVLIAVLGGILILTIIVFALANSVRGAADELQNHKEHLQAYYLARGGVFTSAWLLSQMSPAADAPIHPGQQSIEWQQDSSKVHVDLTDETGKIDLNQVQEPLLEKLLMALGYEMETARPLATAIVDWRNPSSLSRWESAQASGNLLEYDPSHATQSLYAAIEELLQVPGMKPEIYYGRYVRHDDGKIVRLPGLSECVTVDSGTGQININYAPYPVLVATTGMNTQAADLHRRRTNGEALCIGRGYHQPVSGIDQRRSPFVTFDSDERSIYAARHRSNERRHRRPHPSRCESSKYDHRTFSASALEG